MDDITQPDRILVGVDGSLPSINALRYAARIATAFDAPLEVVTTWNYPMFMYEAPTDWSPEQDAIDLLDQTIQDAFGGEPPDLARQVVAGPPARTLVALSETSAMLVVGSRGHGGFGGLLLGSVSAACAEHARCPVLIVHERGTLNAPAETS